MSYVSCNTQNWQLYVSNYLYIKLFKIYLSIKSRGKVTCQFVSNPDPLKNSPSWLHTRNSVILDNICIAKTHHPLWRKSVSLLVHSNVKADFLTDCDKEQFVNSSLPQFTYCETSYFIMSIKWEVHDVRFVIK